MSIQCRRVGLSCVINCGKGLLKNKVQTRYGTWTLFDHWTEFLNYYYYYY